MNDKQIEELARELNAKTLSEDVLLIMRVASTEYSPGGEQELDRSDYYINLVQRLPSLLAKMGLEIVEKGIVETIDNRLKELQSWVKPAPCPEKEDTE